jgi:vacuolar-type H+-ATPase subunit H
LVGYLTAVRRETCEQCACEAVILGLWAGTNVRSGGDESLRRGLMSASGQSSMDPLELINRLDELVKGAKHLPFSDEVRVNKQEIRDLLDEMRAAMPEEIKEARWIVQERREVLSEARREAEQTAQEARERQAEFASGHELIRQAERTAVEIIESARVRARELHLGAENYAEETLSTLELTLAKRVAAIQRGRERLRSADEGAGTPAPPTGDTGGAFAPG